MVDIVVLLLVVGVSNNFLVWLFSFGRFMNAIQPIATRVPYMALPGNHEVVKS